MTVRIDQERHICYGNKKSHISVKKIHKQWFLMSFTAAGLKISESPFNMAVLHGNLQYVQRFLRLQGNLFHASTEFNPYHAACITDDVRIMALLFNDGVVKFGNTPLHTACEWGSKEAVKYLITKRKCDVNACNDLGETPLHSACHNRRTDIVKILFENGCTTGNKINKYKESPLHLACLHDDSSVASLILDSKVEHSNIDIQDNYGDTPLMNACRKGNAFLVKRLIDEGCNPMYANEHSMETPVHVACRMQRLDILQILVQNCINNSKIDNRNNFGETPLAIAINNDCIDIVDFLVSKQLCDLSLSLHSSSPFLALGEPTGDTALHFACERNDLKLVQLLSNYSPLNVVNNVGNTPFHVAANNQTVSVMECLIAKYSDSLDRFVNSGGDSALHLACEKGSLQIVKILVDRCNVTLKNLSGNTPIHVACSKKLTKVVSCLLKKCSGNLDCHRNNMNNTFLHIATQVGDLKTVRLLLKHCSATYQNSNGNTPIHIACSTNQQSVVECLLDNIESTHPFVNKKGQTYLHAACTCNKHAEVDIVKLIIEKGFKILGNYQDNDGDTPLHYACRLNLKEIVEYLLTDERCDPYKQNNQGISPLYSMVQLRHFEFFKELLSKKLYDPNQPLKKGSPLLHCLVEHSSTTYRRHYRQYQQLSIWYHELDYRYIPQHYSNSDILNMFVYLFENYRTGIDFNATNSDGNTVLHLACQFEEYDIIYFLLSIESDIVRQSVSHRNHADKTPIQLTGDYRIIRLLISYGANPEDVYEHFAAILTRSKEEQPLEPTIKVIVLGNSTAGKTTLVEALKSSDINSDLIHVQGSTAGIVTCEHNSNVFGRVTFHDFAGQPEYESSHSAFLETFSSSVQPPLFLLVVDASQYQYIEKQIHNWLSFIQNHCTFSTETPPHVIVIGSHIDKVEDIQMSHINDTYVKAIENFKSSVFECFQPLFLDCRKVGTEEMKALYV